MNIADLCAQHDPEPLPDPREAAELALLEVPHFFPPDVAAALAKLDAKGLTFRWKSSDELRGV